MGRLQTVKQNGSVIATYGYDKNGNRTSLAYPSGVTTSYTYNLANLVTGLQNQKGSTTLSSYSYTYFLDGNQRTKVDQNNKTTTYTYDGLGRLTREQDTQGLNLSYAYDTFSNRKTLTSTGTERYVTSYAYDKNNRLLREEKAVVGATLISSYYYDANGNTTAMLPSMLSTASGTNPPLSLSNTLDEAVLYEYDGFNRQVKVETGETTAEYTYKANGLRHSKTVDDVTTTHVWDGANIVLDMTDGAVTNTYLRGIGLIASESSEGREYYLFNAHGDVTERTDSSGVVTMRYEYDAFGNRQEVFGYPTDAPDTNPFRYCGEYFDEETGTIYLRARYYNPRNGRFTQQDTVSGITYTLPNGTDVPDPLSLNLYTYGHNNPVKYSDPSGHIAELVNFIVVKVGDKFLVYALGTIGIGLAGYGGMKIGEIIQNSDVQLIGTFNTYEDLLQSQYGTAIYGDSITSKEFPGTIYVDSTGGLHTQSKNLKWDDYDWDEDAPTRERVGKQKGKAPRNNQAQNEQTDAAANEAGLTAKQREELHRRVGGQGYSYQEILEEAWAIKNGG